MNDRTFPILGTGQSVPYAFVEQFARRLHGNHSQTVERLAQRGGLSWCELFFAMHDKQFPWSSQINKAFPFEQKVRSAIVEWESMQ